MPADVSLADRTWLSRWETGMRGKSCSLANIYAILIPSFKDPVYPGPIVTAIASRSDIDVRLVLANASLITIGRFSLWCSIARIGAS